MRILFTAFLALFLLGPANTSAQQTGKAVDCYCTDASGSRVELGETICLFVDGRAFQARCEMALNNPIWRETGEPCVLSGPLPNSGETRTS